MANIIVPTRWRFQKPPVSSQINWGHPLAKGLTLCYLFNDHGAKVVRDLATDNHGVCNSTAIWRKGKLISYNNRHPATLATLRKDSNIYMGNYYITPRRPRDFELTNQMSVVTHIRVTGNNGACIIADNTWGNDANGFRFYQNFATTQFRVGNINDNIASVGSNGNTSTRFVAGTCRPGTAGLKVYTQSNEGATPHALVVGTDDLGAYNLSISLNTQIGMSAAFGNPLWGWMDYFYIYNRNLSANEVLSLYLAPYQFIQPIRRRFISVPSGATAWTKNLTESISINDSLSRLADYSRGVTEAISASDTPSRLGDYNRKVIDALAILDILSQRDVGKGLIDTVGIADTVNKLTIAHRGITEALGIADVVTEKSEYFKNLIETIGISDVFSKLTVANRNFILNVLVADSLEKQIVKHLTQGVGLSDSLSKHVVKVLTDQINIYDILVRAFTKFLIETVSTNDIVTTAKIAGAAFILRQFLTPGGLLTDADRLKMKADFPSLTSDDITKMEQDLKRILNDFR